MFWVLGVGTALSQSERCPDSTQENFFQRGHIILTNKVLTRTIRVNKKTWTKCDWELLFEKVNVVRDGAALNQSWTWQFPYLIYYTEIDLKIEICHVGSKIQKQKVFIKRKHFRLWWSYWKKWSKSDIQYYSVGSELNVLIRTLLPLTVTRFSEYNHHVCVWF